MTPPAPTARTAPTSSIRLAPSPRVRYLLRIGDTALIHAQRLAEWCGHGPVLEEDIAFSNLALDLLGQARAVLTLAGREPGFDEDQLAYWRDEDQFFNLTLVELPMRRSSAHAPGGDFADAVLRTALLSIWLELLWAKLEASSDAELAGIAAKAVKEARYHRQHAGDWVVRLGDGTDESARRIAAALQRAWPYTAELFAHDAVDETAAATGLGPARRALAAPWQAAVAALFNEAQLVLPPTSPFVSTGTQGVHSEHMGFILAEMQSLQRRYPGGRW